MSIHQQLSTILSTISGDTGVYARSLDSRSAAEAIEFHADRTFTLASVSKLPLLIHLLRKFDQGELQLDDRIELRANDRVAGGGLIQFLDSGLQPTVRDLMLLMIIISDNMATDLLLDLTSKQAVEADMHSLGYASFFMPHSIRQALGSFLPGGADTPYDEAVAEFRKVDREIPDDPDGNSAERGMRATPRDLARMLVDLHGGNLASPEATKLGMDILTACQTNSRIPALLPKGTQVAHKTGTLNRRTNDAGIVFAPNGPYVVVLLNHGELDESKASAALAEASLALYEHLGRKPEAATPITANPVI